MITNVTGMGEVRLGLDLSTICTSEDDDVNNEGGTSTGAGRRRNSQRCRAFGGAVGRAARWGRAWPRSCRAGWRRRGPGGGEWHGARACRRARARTSGPALACRCRATRGAAAMPGRRGGPPSPGRWPLTLPPLAPVSARP
jgi:hypothetical protein